MGMLGNILGATLGFCVGGPAGAADRALANPVCQ